jgi:polyferredoxin
MRLQRVIQALCLGLFLLLLWQAVHPFAGWLVRLLAPDMFLRLDPLAVLGSGLAARSWLAGGVAVLLSLAATACIGRFFCGLVCPMGTSIDVADRLLRGPTSRGARTPHQMLAPHDPTLRRLKYWLLVFTLVAGALGVSYVFLFSPQALITRLYGLLLFPMLQLLGEHILAPLRPLAESLGFFRLYYLEIAQPRFATQFFVLGFFAVVFGLGLLAPRFWCRHLCPAGALFALFGHKPLLRRRVSQECIDCGQCQKRCPMGAIPEDPRATLHGECVICQTCVAVCPVSAVSFGFGKGAEHAAPPRETLPGRRAFLVAGVAGIGGALTAMTGLTSPHSPEGKGALAPELLLRPPGALPEHDFLARCLRCGECMRACPTGALRLLPTLAEKIHCKLGTARVLPWKCLAWEHQRECLVCDEVCPFDAIELRGMPGNPAPVPIVHEERCAGCGFCEHHCPVREQRAIVVEPMGAIRLARGSYVDEAQARGLRLTLEGHGKGVTWSEGRDLPPGFSEPGPGAASTPNAGEGAYPAPSLPDDDLPPGFSNPTD